MGHQRPVIIGDAAARSAQEDVLLNSHSHTEQLVSRAGTEHSVGGSIYDPERCVSSHAFL